MKSTWTLLEVLADLADDKVLQEWFSKHGLHLTSQGASSAAEGALLVMRALQSVRRPDMQERLCAGIQQVSALAHPAGRLAMFEVAGARRDVLTGLASCKSDLHRAVWLCVHHPDLFDEACTGGRPAPEASWFRPGDTATFATPQRVPRGRGQVRRHPGAGMSPRAEASLRYVPVVDRVALLPLQELLSGAGRAAQTVRSTRGSAGGSRDSDSPQPPCYGPFSADFTWVWLEDWPQGPIRLTEAQAAVFRALWLFGGQGRSAEDIMREAGLCSDKPGDLFKVRRKGDPLYEGPQHAYRTLVITKQRAGTYAMPCAQQSKP